MDANTGLMLKDFVSFGGAGAEKDKNVLHLLNVVSPGWTCAFPFTRWLVDDKIAPILK
jgi:hypothetical protein